MLDKYSTPETNDCFMIRASLNVFMLAGKSWWVGGGGQRIFRLHLFQTQTMRECSVYYNIDVEWT